MGNTTVRATPEFKYFEKDVLNWSSNYLGSIEQHSQASVIVNQEIEVWVGGDLNCTSNLIMTNSADVAIVIFSQISDAQIRAMNAELMKKIDASLKVALRDAKPDPVKFPQDQLDKDIVNITRISERNIENNVKHEIKNTIALDAAGKQIIRLKVAGDVNSDNCVWTNSSVIDLLGIQVTGGVTDGLLNNPDVMKILSKYRDGSGEGNGSGNGEGNGNGNGNGSGGGVQIITKVNNTYLIIAAHYNCCTFSLYSCEIIIINFDKPLLWLHNHQLLIHPIF